MVSRCGQWKELEGKKLRSVAAEMRGHQGQSLWLRQAGVKTGNLSRTHLQHRLSRGPKQLRVTYFCTANSRDSPPRIVQLFMVTRSQALRGKAR